MKYTTIRELKSNLRNFAWTATDKDGDTLEEKVEIINRVWFGDNTSDYLDPNGIVWLLEKIDKEGDGVFPYGSLYYRAQQQIIDVLSYFAWGHHQDRPDSLAVYEPAKIIATTVDVVSHFHKDKRVANNLLLTAVNKHNPEAVKDALAKGADPNLPLKSRDGSTLLMWAVANATDKNQRFYYGQNGLQRATSSREVDVVKALVEAGADVNAADAKGNTVLTRALCANSGTQAAIIQVLLDAGADIELGNTKKRRTPLSKAVFYLQDLNVKVLLENGADPFVRDSSGKDLLEVAETTEQSFNQKQRENVISLLKKYMSR